MSSDKVIQALQSAQLTLRIHLNRYEHQYGFVDHDPPTSAVSQNAYMYNIMRKNITDIDTILDEFKIIETPGARIQRLAQTGNMDIIQREIDYHYLALVYYISKYNLDISNIDPDRSHAERGYIIIRERLNTLMERYENLKNQTNSQ